MSAFDKHTTDHDEIKRWVEDHDGVPAVIKSGSSRHLKILFPQYSMNEQAEEVPWPKWFDDFDKEDLVFEYKEDVEDGEEVKAFRLIQE